MTTREQHIEALVRHFKPDWPGKYSPEDPADATTNVVFTASDGHPSIRALTFGEVYDALLETLPLPLRSILEEDEQYAVVKVGEVPSWLEPVDLPLSIKTPPVIYRVVRHREQNNAS